MTIDGLIMLMGALVAALPFLGFPIFWDNIILVMLGVLIITIGIIIRRRGISPAKKRTTVFVENTPHSTNDHEAA